MFNYSSVSLFKNTCDSPILCINSLHLFYGEKHVLRTALEIGVLNK